ncbi:hypothetical protein EDD17DRAFT_1892285 [Pisolithus thermaeus]|nr:hypothetical protein EDD17DRAFT_1892285 [Pisolithus thermaeus]
MPSTLSGRCSIYATALCHTWPVAFIERLLVRDIREEIRIYQQDGVERSRSQPLRNDRDSCAFAEHVFAGLRLLCWLAFVHPTGIYLFTRGFLLSRLALPNKSQEEQEQWSRFATHKRAALLVIDALRFDFVSDRPPDPPRRTTTISSLLENSLRCILTIPSSLTRMQTHRRRRSNGSKVLPRGLYPPWLTSEKAFHGRSYKKTLCFTNWAAQDTRSSLEPWTPAIGHGLGVDHAGHRVGSDHPVMKAKLEQVNTFLGRLVRIVDEDTLLILLGGCGVDQMGNHGGGRVLETSSAVWMYGRSASLSSSSISLLVAILPETTSPGERLPHRSIQQLDLVTTISLLLGLPIPFNNPGSII